MVVELSQLVGEMGTKSGPVSVRHNVDRVLVDGSLAGWLARKDGAKFCPTKKLDPITASQVVAELARLRGEVGLSVSDVSGAGIPSDAALREAEELSTEVAEDE